ncbi:MAG TPA: hypothetical protein VF088_19055 [Pyrinomonadaceae bacterium]
MQQEEGKVQQPGDANDAPTMALSPASLTPTALLSPQSGEETCVACGDNPNGGEMGNFVYAIGRIEPRFPSHSVEKEFVQATGRAETAGLTDREALYKVLSERQNRYLVRQLGYVLTIEGLDTYILQPRNSADFDLLVEAIRTAPRSTDVDVVIGTRGSIAPAEMFNGLMLPLVTFDQIYSFDVDSFIESIPRSEKIPEDEFKAAAEEVFMRIMQMVDNSGATDEYRAVNYLALRYPQIYGTAAECHARECSLAGVEVRPSSLSGVRKILDVIFSYTDRKTDFTEKYFVRVDVSEEFPFLVTKMSPYFDR